mgnify:CR=1 FL=1
MMVRWKIPLGIGIVLLFVSTTWSASGTMSVQVRDGQLRSAPSFLGPVVGGVNYGDQVMVQQQQGDWVEVSCKSQKGWIHSSALTSRNIAAGSGGKDAQLKASGKEVALAGKGFNAEVEAQYRKGQKNTNYAAVDRMERISVSSQEMVTFLDKGELKPGVGGGK